MDATDFHKDWLGLLRDQQVGLVVSAAALVAAQVYLDRDRLADDQDTLLRLLDTAPVATPDGDDDDSPRRGRRARRELLQRLGDAPRLPDFRRLALDLLAWPEQLLVPAAGEDRFRTYLAEYHDTIEATWALVRKSPAEPILLIREEDPGLDLDEPIVTKGWSASPQARFERLLRDTKIPIGVLSNATSVRLVYAPGGETSGHLTFPVRAMTEVSGRPILGGLVTLLHKDRLLVGVPGQRLPALLAQSRLAQDEVSQQLADQVLLALHALVRGFQSASEAAPATFGVVLSRLLSEEPAQVYGGLLATLMRLVFVLYAEDRGLMPQGEAYTSSYALTGLFAQLREDAAHHPDTMHQRFGAWPRLLALFRLIHDGSRHQALRLPARHGKLFNPDAYPFLEGRQGPRSQGDSCKPPLVADGVLFEVLSRLLFVDGQRISYRTLDVEQIGSVYEHMMGFEVKVAKGRSLAVRPEHVVLDLDATLALSADARAKALKEAGARLTGAALSAWKSARSVEQLQAALGPRVSPRTPHLLARDAFFLQPGQERRKSGSHYTPRALTQPIVATTLAPLLRDLGPSPTPAQILALKVCDPAMGSGAFLVETCRQLALALVRAWENHPADIPRIPPDEDAELHARRLISQRCLYGVDKNPFAVDLAKLSLWLFTLAREHPFTFLDHALRHGDSLVGLDHEQIANLDWKRGQKGLVRQVIAPALRQAMHHRLTIHALGDSDEDGSKDQENQKALAAVAPIEAGANLALLAFFAHGSERERESRRLILRDTMIHPSLDQIAWLAALSPEERAEAREDPRFTLHALREMAADLADEHRIPALHWPLAFPEVFPPGPDDSSPPPAGGFDAIVGNPPFAGKNTLLAGTSPAYLDWLKVLHEESHGNADLVAHFFRRAFSLLRPGGTFGLIATNTIAQGDTRSTGLRWIRQHGGTIYNATRRYRWPGLAAVVVSVVHVRRAEPHPAHDPSRSVSSPSPSMGRGPGGEVSLVETRHEAILDHRPVPLITAFLFHQGSDDDPAPLPENESKSFQGSVVLGMGFTFDDTNPEQATPLIEMRRLIAKDARNQERIFPYLGGEELNSSPTQSHHRYVINFGQMSEDDARQWPDLMAIVERKVKPERLEQKREIRSRYWWRFGEVAPALYRAIQPLKRVLAISRVGQHAALGFLPAQLVFSDSLVVLTFDRAGAFACLQSRPHELWARFFGSSMKDDLRYTPSDCFETFPFPAGWQTNAALEAVGEEYHAFRARLMADEGVRAELMESLPPEGLTRTYNRFHDEACELPGIVKLRELHEKMDRAVLDAYGWQNVPTACEFLAEPGQEDEEEPKKRYRWPDEVRDEVLARLLALNAERAPKKK